MLYLWSRYICVHNLSVFAYGATGAGKTHTMLGNPEKPGVMYLTMMELYNRMEAMEGDRTCDVAVSYLEVSLEKYLSVNMLIQYCVYRHL